MGFLMCYRSSKFVPYLFFALGGNHATSNQAYKTNKANVKHFRARNTKCQLIYTMRYLVLIDNFFLSKL